MRMRNANIGVAVGSLVIFGGAFLLRNSGDGPMLLVVLAAFGSVFAVVNVLDGRDERRRDRSQ